MANEDIKAEVKESGLRHWHVAYYLNMDDSRFSRKLRLELPEREKAEIRAAIRELSATQRKTI